MEQPNLPAEVLRKKVAQGNPHFRLQSFYGSSVLAEEPQG